MTRHHERQRRGGRRRRCASGLPVVDMVTGLNAALGVLLALQERAAQRPRPVRRGRAVRLAACRCCIRMRPTGSSTAARRTAPATPTPTSTPTTALAHRHRSDLPRRRQRPPVRDPLPRTSACRRWPTTSASRPPAARSVHREALKALLEACSRATTARRWPTRWCRRRAVRAGAVGAARRSSIRTPRIAGWWSRWTAATAASRSPIKLSAARRRPIAIAPLAEGHDSCRARRARRRTDPIRSFPDEPMADHRPAPPSSGTTRCCSTIS